MKKNNLRALLSSAPLSFPPPACDIPKKIALVRLSRRVVNLNVLKSRPVPAPVLSHAVRLKRTEFRGLVVGQTDSTVQRVIDGRVVGAIEAEPVGLHALPFGLSMVDVVVEHGVVEPAGAAHNGHGTVTHGDQLGQTARLEHRRHKDHVGASVNEVAEGLVVVQVEAHVVMVPVLQVVEHHVEVLLDLRVGRGAEQDYLATALERAHDAVPDEVHTLDRKSVV